MQDPRNSLSEPRSSSHWLPVLILAALAFVLNWYYLTGGFNGDDIIFLNMFREDPLPYARWQGPWYFTEPACLERLWWYTGSSF